MKDSNSLIPVASRTIGGASIQAVNGRDLHAFLGVKKDYSNWAKAQIERAGFAENVDYVKTQDLSSPKKASAKSRPQVQVNYHFTLSAAKEISMMSNTPKGKEARLYFIDCERRAKEATAAPALPDFTNPAAAARAWATQYEERQRLENKVKEDAPKVEFTEDVVASGKEMTITAAAKTLGIGPKKLFDWLRQRKFLYSQSTQAMQTAITRGLMVVRFADITRTDGTKEKKAHAHVTGAGLFYFYQRLREEGLIDRNPNLELAA